MTCPASHLASWAGVCPGNHESAGKRKSGKARKGNAWLRRVLVQAPHAASKTKKTYLTAQYHRLSARRGAKRAALAVAHTILVIIYHLLQDQVSYRELNSEGTISMSGISRLSRNAWFADWSVWVIRSNCNLSHKPARNLAGRELFQKRFIQVMLFKVVLTDTLLSLGNPSPRLLSLV